MRNARLTHVSLLAIAVTLMSMPRAAQAQSFNANGEVVAGAGLVDNATPGQTNVFLDSPNAVVNWTLAVPAGSGPFVFQPAGTTATFTNRDSTSFTVLNRIISTGSPRAMQFNGTVVSQLTDLATGSVSRGGTLFFYSPNGIVVGSTGVFNVGNLVLTSSDLGYDPVTGEFGKGGIYSFLPANAGSSVEVRKGAQIIAGPTNAYVGLVAPKVVNSGTITVDGSAVLVAADASTITFRPNGLFDIQIDLGTSATGEVVTNDGTITGTVGSVNVAHRLYVVAVPRNDAITMAIKGGSKLGFDIAVAAGEEDGAIVLSAGYDIADGVLAGVRSPNGGAGPAALTIGAIDATSPLTGQATGQALLQVEGGKAANFASDVSIAGVSDPSGASADGAIVSVSGVGSTLDIAGDLLVRSLDGGIVTGSGVSDANAARIVVSDGRMTVLGNATADASRNGYAGQVSQGGEAALVASGNAVVEVGKDLVLSGDAIGQAVDDASTLGSFSGIGGNAHLSLGSGASVTVDGNLAVHAAGSGGDVGTSGYVGADGTGGTAVVEGLAGGGALTVAGTLAVDATGTGANGNTCTACVVEGGLGTGGTAGISAAAGITLTITGATSVDASGQGGAATADKGKTGGAGLGGAAFVRSTGGAVIAGGPLSVLANGTGGAGALTDSAVSGATGSGGTGGAGTGGTARLTAGDAATIGGGGSIAIAGTAMVSASGAGGAGGTGGAGLGGTAALSARNGKVTGTNLSTRALGLGGAGSNGGNGGAGSGGTAALMAYSALEGDAAVTFGTTVITARGTGGAGAAPELLADAGGAGGLGTGGTASAMAEAGNGSVVLGVTSINASGGGGIGGAGGAGFSGTGGAGGAGGTGRGGTATIGVTSGLDTGAVNTGSAAFDGTSVLANGNGGTGGAGGIGSVTGAAGTGGNAQGGGAALVAQGGTVTLLAAAQVRADAQGGSGGLGSGGNAAIGDDGSAADPRGVRLVVGNRTGHADQKGQLTGAALEFSAGASAGKGATQGTATNLGHPLTFLLDGGAIDATSLDFAGRGVSAALAPPSVIDLAGGDTTLTGAFRFVTPGTLAAALGGADVFSDTALVSASDWLPGAAPAGPSGTIHGTTGVSLLTSGNLFAFLSAETGGSLALTASGLIRLDALTATGSITVNAGTSLLLADVTAGGDASLVATGTVGLGNVGAGGDAVLTSGGALAAGAVTTGQSAVIDGASSIALGGDVVAGDSVQLVSDGAVNGKGLSAGLVSPSAASGATYEITVFSNGAVGLGALSAARDIKLFTPVDLTVGALSGREIAVLADGPQSIGSIAATGRVLLADYAMTPSGGNPLAGYDLDALFAAAPIASGAAITVRGSATAGSLTATTTSDLSAGTIAATGGILLQAGGALATGDLGGSVVSLAAGTTLTAGDISATDGAVTLRAAGDMTAGSISAVGSVSLASTGGKVTIATVGAAGDVTLVAASDVEAGALTAGGLLLSSGANVALGDTQGSRITVSANGDLSIGGVAATSGRAELTAVGALSSGAITAATRIALSSGA
ncbi:MAG: beta strand repeat-containing protein, partial [Novosphingobium sp.]